MATNTGSSCVYILGTGELTGSAECLKPATGTIQVVYTYTYIPQVDFSADQFEGRNVIRPSMLFVSGVGVYIGANKSIVFCWC